MFSPKRNFVLGDTTEVKEESSDRRDNGVSGPNPDAEAVLGLLVPARCSAQLALKMRAHETRCCELRRFLQSRSIDASARICKVHNEVARSHGLQPTKSQVASEHVAADLLSS